MATLTKKEIRIKFINHPNSRGIIEEHFGDYYKYDEEMSLYYNTICFLEIVRTKGLWDNLIKALQL